jgi:hypothetical protein
VALLLWEVGAGTGTRGRGDRKDVGGVDPQDPQDVDGWDRVDGWNLKGGDIYIYF